MPDAAGGGVPSGPGAVYVREDEDRFVPTELATGPWSPDAQHGGPPAALLGRAVEQFERDDAWFVARTTVELLRPVPLVPLVVSTRLVRPGKRVQLVEASLRAGDVEVTRALALRLRQGEVELPPPAAEDAVPPGPDDLDPPVWPPMEWIAFGEAMDMRVVSGTFRQSGP